jgi:SAM-dependent methyltransferase
MTEAPELESKRLAALYAFLRSWLPAPPTRVLEVGCGRGDLARALAAGGYAVTAIDPEAPDGPIFQRTRLEDFRPGDEFDAVVGSVSLHHVDDLGAALDRIVGLLRPGGLLILDEFAKERFSGATRRWYYHQRRARAVIDRDDHPVPDDFQTWEREWEQKHAEIHPHAEMRPEIDRRFSERFFAWGPYLFSYWLDDALEPLERKLIETGAIEATGFRYVGALGSQSQRAVTLAA